MSARWTSLTTPAGPSLLASALRSYTLLKAKTVQLQRAERSNSQYTSNGFEAMSHLSHEMLHDAMKGKDMATRSDLRAQGVGLQGYGTLHFATCHHDYLRKICGQHVVCDSWQKIDTPTMQQEHVYCSPRKLLCH